MRDYVTLSIETHPFFRKDHERTRSFLKAGFPCCEKDFIEEAEYFLRKFEELLNDTLKNFRRKCS